MTDPTADPAPPARPSIATLTATNLVAMSPQAAERLKDVPAERLREKGGSAILGTLFFLPGALILLFALWLAAHVILGPLFAFRHQLAVPTTVTPPSPTTLTFIGVGAIAAVGIAFMVIGAAIADLEIVKNPFLFFVAFLRGVVDAARGRGAAS